MQSASVSDLGSFSSCRRQWYLGRQWTSSKISRAAWSGSAIHAGIGKYYETGTLEQGLAAIDEFRNTEFDQFDRLYGDRWLDQSDELEAEAALAKTILANYDLFEKTNPVLSGNVLHVEKSIRHPIVDGFLLSGRIDLLIERADGLWIVDHKTTSGTLSDPPGLDVDEQMTAYVYLVYKALGEMPRGVIYNMIARSVPDFPRVLKNGELSKDLSQKTVYDLYIEAIRVAGLDPGDYFSVLDIFRARGWSSFFRRVSSRRNASEVRSFEERAIRKIRDIEGILRNPQENAYSNPSSWSCSYCPFLSVCKTMEDGGDAEYQLKSQFTPRVSNLPLKTSSSPDNSSTLHLEEEVPQ